ncbi:MAG: hypothetical protein Q8S09_14870, partial [Hyphomonas sp.]|nr:hypothetical protein [Hyphomonas sp.]
MNRVQLLAAASLAVLLAACDQVSLPGAGESPRETATAESAESGMPDAGPAAEAIEMDAAQGLEE